MLKIRDLHVEVNGKEILSGLNLDIERGQRHMLMGSNASGKTTLALTVMGFPRYKIARGEVVFNGKCLNGLTIDERAGLGIAMAFQSPPEVDVNFGELITKIEARFGSQAAATELGQGHFRHRNLNDGLSGGEKKQSELIQVLAMRPELIILDEVDSGVDIDSLKLIGQILNKRNESMLIITHYRHILNHLKVDRIHLLALGRIVVSGPPDTILDGIERHGYRAYLKGLGICKECPLKECVIVEEEHSVQ